MSTLLDANGRPFDAQHGYASPLDRSDDEWHVPIHNIRSDPPQPPEFLTERLVPAREVTLLGAHGGVGKSMLMLMWAVHAALGRKFLGLRVTAGPACFYSGEDPPEIVRWRYSKLVDSMELNDQQLEQLAHCLFILDASEQPCLYVKTYDRDGGVMLNTTPQFERLQRLIARKGILHNFVDNASSVASINEIDRHEVDSFIRALRFVGRRRDVVARTTVSDVRTATVLAAHVNKVVSNQAGKGDPTVQAYSGSTAWHNACRSRLYLDLAGDQLSELVLSHGKSNHGERADSIRLQRGHAGVLSALDAEQAAEVRQQLNETKVAELVRVLRSIYEGGQYVPAAVSGGFTAHHALQASPLYPRGTKSKETNALLLVAEQMQRVKRGSHLATNGKYITAWLPT